MIYIKIHVFALTASIEREAKETKMQEGVEWGNGQILLKRYSDVEKEFCLR
jgi:hypothetical protein